MRKKIVEVATERTNTKCSAYLPVRVALTLSGSTQDVLGALQDLLDLTGTISYLFDARDVPIRFDLAEYSDFFSEYAEVPIKEFARGYLMLRATAESEHVVGHFYDPETGAPSLNVSFEDRLDASKYSAAEELKKTLFELTSSSQMEARRNRNCPIIQTAV